MGFLARGTQKSIAYADQRNVLASYQKSINYFQNKKKNKCDSCLLMYFFV